MVKLGNEILDGMRNSILQYAFKNSESDSDIQEPTQDEIEECEITKKIHEAMNDPDSIGIAYNIGTYCCSTCGHAEMWPYDASDDPPTYFFCHIQEVYRWINDSSRDYAILQWGGDGDKITSALSRYFEVEWDGSERNAIKIKL